MLGNFAQDGRPRLQYSLRTAQRGILGAFDIDFHDTWSGKVIEHPIEREGDHGLRRSGAAERIGCPPLIRYVEARNSTIVRGGRRENGYRKMVDQSRAMDQIGQPKGPLLRQPRWPRGPLPRRKIIQRWPQYPTPTSSDAPAREPSTEGMGRLWPGRAASTTRLHRPKPAAGRGQIRAAGAASAQLRDSVFAEGSQSMAKYNKYGGFKLWRWIR